MCERRLHVACSRFIVLTFLLLSSWCRAQTVIELTLTMSDQADLGASSAVAKLFAPDMTELYQWVISHYHCSEHGMADTLQASPAGSTHKVQLPLPDGLLQGAGTHVLLLLAQDRHQSLDKAHRRKAALGRSVCLVIAPAALLVLNEVQAGGGEIDHTSDAQEAYALLKKLWDPARSVFVPGYYGWRPLGDAMNGGSGVVINPDAREAIHTLNRRCPYYDQRQPASVAKPNAVWVFYGHANPFGLSFDPSGAIDWIVNALSEDPSRRIYNILCWRIDFVRLAFLHGCGTAGGVVKGRDQDGRPFRVPETGSASLEQSIAGSFHQQGADAVVGFQDLQYAGKVFSAFNREFWTAVCQKGMSVRKAVRHALKHRPWWTRLWASERRALEKVRVLGDAVLTPPGYGY